YDFSYLAGRPKRIQRLAALYEYARESDELISDIADFRKYGMALIGSLLSTYPWDEAFFLGQVNGFPQLSFNQVLQDGLPNLPEIAEVSEVEVEPFSEICHRFKKYSTLQGGCEMVQKSLGRFGRTQRSAYVIIIHWGRFPDANLVDHAAKLLLKRRRYETGWIRPGRRGTPQSVSGIDYLHQLSVFRFRQSGGTFEDRPS